MQFRHTLLVARKGLVVHRATPAGVYCLCMDHRAGDPSLRCPSVRSSGPKSAWGPPLPSHPTCLPVPLLTTTTASLRKLRIQRRHKTECPTEEATDKARPLVVEQCYSPPTRCFFRGDFVVHYIEIPTCSMTGLFEATSFESREATEEGHGRGRG